MGSVFKVRGGPKIIYSDDDKRSLLRTMRSSSCSCNELRPGWQRALSWKSVVPGVCGPMRWVRKGRESKDPSDKTVGSTEAI